ncbi:MAG: alpha/beta hydrolase [Deltaproteobacteria bacterium]|nr:alpha/beta hydrolase [Deltaproteobacteria bacterium]
MRDGLRIAADHYGSPDAEPVLFLHGGGQTRHSWDEAARAVTERGWRAVCADLRGHGESEWSPSGVYSASELANDVKDLVAAVGDQPVIVAASLGGLASMVAAGEAPDQLLRGLVLVDVAPTLEAEGVERIVKFMSAFPEGFESVESAADSIAEYLPHRPRPENSSGLEKNLRQRADGRWIWHWDPRLLDRYLGGDTVKMTRVEEAAEKITCPTLLLRGSLSDVVSEETAERFVSRLPRAKWRDVSRARHMLAGDANDPFMEAVLGFLDELRSPTGPTW